MGPEPSLLTLISAFQNNYIYLLQTGRAVWIIDPGDAEPVLAHLQQEQLRPTAILCTHHHADHVGGVRRLVQEYAVPVYGHGKQIPELSHPLGEGEYTIDGERVGVLEVPGHTLDHIAYLWQSTLFCGDTLFAGGCGRIFEGDPEMMYHSLQKLADLPDATQVCCAHEYTQSNLRFAAAVEPDNPAVAERIAKVDQIRSAGEPSLPSSLADERVSNPFLRCDQRNVASSARAHGARDESPVAVFASLRRWKDGFH